MDPIEEYLGKWTVDMTRWELISYLKHAMLALYGFELAAEGRSEPGIMERLQETYGARDAGLIVKWVVWKHFCRDSVNPGQYIKFTSFAKGRKWWVDIMHAEMQERVAAESAAKPEHANSALWLL